MTDADRSDNSSLGTTDYKTMDEKRMKHLMEDEKEKFQKEIIDTMDALSLESQQQQRPAMMMMMLLLLQSIQEVQ